MGTGDERYVKGRQAAWVGIIANILLTGFKFTAGVVGKSQAMIADAVESLSDVVSHTVVLISLKISKKPVDWDHPYGHGRAESIATGLVAIFVASAGLAIIWRTVNSILSGHEGVPGRIALLAAVVTIGVKEGLYQYAARMGRKFKSSVLMAGAADHRKDALTSVATLIGIAGARSGYPVLDPLAAGLVSVVILRLAYNIAVTATGELMDRQPEDDTMRQIVAATERCDGVEHAYVRARRLGPSVFVDIKIDIDPNLTVSEGHNIAKAVKEDVLRWVEGVVDVMVHVNPHYD